MTLKQRRRRLIKGPSEFREDRVDLRGEAVYTFTPIGIVPRRPNPAA